MKDLTPISLANLSPMIKASYLTELFVVRKLKNNECLTITHFKPSRIMPTPYLNLLDDPSNYRTQLNFCFF